MTASSPDLAGAIVAALDDDALDALAARLAPRLARHMKQADDDALDRWLDSRQAAAYAGCGLSTLQRAAAAGEIESCQDCEYGKRWFRAGWIDAWRMDATPSATAPYAASNASKTLPERRPDRLRHRQQAQENPV